MLTKQILVAESDLTICQSIQNHMQSENIGVHMITSSADVLASIKQYEYCLIIISVDPSKMCDMEMLHIIRSAKRIPIIALTDKLATNDKLMLFQTGANAHFERPIDIPVCVAQAKSLLHLFLEVTGENPSYQPLIFGTELIIHPIYHQVIIDGELLPLTRKEFDLLLCLARHPGQIWSRTQLYCQVWSDDLGISGENTVKAHIGNLRKKLADVGKEYIQTSWGVGYKFVPPIGNDKSK